MAEGIAAVTMRDGGRGQTKPLANCAHGLREIRFNGAGRMG